MTAPLIKKSAIAHSFSLAAKTYDQFALLQHEIGQRLLERLDLLSKPPERILDVGAGTGFLTRKLQQKFPRSQLVGLDLAFGMMEYAKRKQPWELWRHKPTYVCADLEQLPLSKQSIDLVFSNFTLQWCFNLPQAFAEFKRILKPQGILLFSTLGPQTLFELRESWARVDPSIHVNAFMDMHHLGDMLLKNGFGQPVVDMEMITMTYDSVKQLLHDLKATGAHNMNDERFKGCTPKGHLAKMLQAYEAFKDQTGAYPATFEVIYGYAIQQEKTTYAANEEGIIRIPADKIPILSS